MPKRKATIVALRAEAREVARATADKPVYIDGKESAQFVCVVGLAVLRASIMFLQAKSGDAAASRVIDAIGDELARPQDAAAGESATEPPTETGDSSPSPPASPTTASVPTTPPLQVSAGPPPEVMTADQVAAFLGVDRNTVYDYAGRGVIPHQRLGKRMLFHRGALVSWLDASCKAASTRKG